MTQSFTFRLFEHNFGSFVSLLLSWIDFSEQILLLKHFKVFGMRIECRFLNEMKLFYTLLFWVGTVCEWCYMRIAQKNIWQKFKKFWLNNCEENFLCASAWRHLLTKPDLRTHRFRGCETNLACLRYFDKFQLWLSELLHRSLISWSRLLQRFKL